MLNQSCESLIAIMRKNEINSFSFIDNPDGVGGEDVGTYFDDSINKIILDGDEFDEFWDDLIPALFDALGVLHQNHPYKRLDGTFTLSGDCLSFDQEWVKVSSRG
jgi:hypothetical protein